MMALKEELQKRVPDANDVGCFMCRLILEDLKEDGRLTGAILDLHRQPVFTRSGQFAHLKLEGIPFNEADLV
jgi:hypothetical protein